MSETVTCSVAAEGDRVHRYVAGTLGLEDAAEFETHEPAAPSARQRCARAWPRPLHREEST